MLKQGVEQGSSWHKLTCASANILQGLTCINQALPEIDIKMVYRQHKLQYDPPLEDVRTKHYKDHLNTFLGLPLRCLHWCMCGGVPM
jgi:hypothetical protein